MPNGEPTIDELREAWVLAEQRVADCRESIEVEYVRLNREEEKCARAWLALCRRKTSAYEGHEIWAAGQLLPGEGIEDGVRRIEKILTHE